jgi:hypothetical protein
MGIPRICGTCIRPECNVLESDSWFVVATGHHDTQDCRSHTVAQGKQSSSESLAPVARLAHSPTGELELGLHQTRVARWSSVVVVIDCPRFCPPRKGEPGSTCTLATATSGRKRFCCAGRISVTTSHRDTRECCYRQRSQ